MLRWLTIGLLGLGLYLIFLATTLPAHLALSWAPLPKEVTLQQPSGTIWQGKLQQLQVGDVKVNQVEWELAFWPLLTGKVEVDTRFGILGSSSLTGQGKLGYAWGTLSAKQLVVELSAQQVMQLAGLRVPLSASGNVRLFVDTYQQGVPWCEQLTGQVDWSGAGVSGRMLPSELQLGSLTGELSCEQGGLVLSMDDTTSPLGLKGTLKLPEQQRYQVSTLVRPDAELPDTVREGVTLFAKQTSEGYLLEMDGRL